MTVSMGFYAQLLKKFYKKEKICAPMAIHKGGNKK